MWRNINLLKRAVHSTLRPVYGPTRLVGPSFQHYCTSSAFAGGGGSEKGGGGGNANAVSYAEAKRLMRLVNVEALKEKLGKEDREVIPYDELIKACQSMGVAKSANEAAAFAGVLDDAGIVLLFRDKVYLHPDKVFFFN